MAEKQKRPNFFVRVAKKLSKLCTDTIGELKKVSWASKKTVKTNTAIVAFSVITMSVAIGLLDFVFHYLLVDVLAKLI